MDLIPYVPQSLTTTHPNSLNSPQNTIVLLVEDPDSNVVESDIFSWTEVFQCCIC